MNIGEKTRAVVRVVAVIFFTWTASAMAFTMLPLESKIRKKLAPVLVEWRSFTGLDQHWNMFATVPHHREYGVKIEIEPATGGGWGSLPEVGPILPGLVEVPSHFRYHTFFTRLNEKPYAGQVEPYREALAGEILAIHPELEGRRYRIRKTASRIHRLDTIRDLGEPGFDQSTLHGPYRLEPRSSEP